MKTIRSSWIAWYAALVLFAVVLSCGVVLTPMASNFPQLTLLTFATTATLTIALASTNIHEYESKKNIRTLRWVFSTKLSTSIQYFTVTLYATLLLLATLREVFDAVILIQSLDMVMNVLVWILIFGFLYGIIHTTSKNRV